ncbi:MAG: MFS transporter [Betaproteobacteria bacterium]|nr:MFS transporter [Betaproteobacteria bacterium]
MPEFLRALRHPQFRTFFIGQLCGAMGSWVQLVAMGWLTYRITGSVFMLGVVGFAGQIALFFLAPVGGMLADRFDRRRMMMINQVLVACQALALALLTYTDTIEAWHLVALSLILGAFYAFDAPIRQAVPIQLVRDGRDLPNAIALVAITTNTARLVGPSVGGVLVALVGEAGCFMVNGAAYLMTFLSISVLRLAPAPARVNDSPLQAIGAGMAYAADTPTIRLMLLFSAAVAFFATAYLTLMPYFTREVYGAGPELLGLLLGAAGMGSLAGSFYLATWNSLHRLPRSVAIAVAVAGAALACFPLTAAPAAGAAVLVMVGFGVVFCAGGANTLLQHLVREDMRGRVMSLFVMCYYGVMPLGSLATGTLAELFGAKSTLVVFGVITALVAALMYRTARRLNWREAAT